MEDSVAQGALLMFFSVNSSPVFRALDRNDSEQYILPSNTRLKKLFVYDIEKNGLLYSGMNHPASVLNDIHQISFYGKFKIHIFILAHKLLFFIVVFS